MNEQIPLMKYFFLFYAITGRHQTRWEGEEAFGSVLLIQSCVEI